MNKGRTIFFYVPESSVLMLLSLFESKSLRCKVKQMLPEKASVTVNKRVT